MINEAQYVYYICYVFAFAIVGIVYLKIKSTEAVIITTREFKEFQARFLFGYAVMILGELIAVGTFYYTMTMLDLVLEQITKLYIVTVVSTTVFGILIDIIDIGTKRNKCILSALLYALAMLTVFGGGNYDLLLIGRIIYGAASSCLHSAFDAYLVNEHSSMGFPEDWLNQTFLMLTHYMALVASLSGALGQTAASISKVGPIAVSAILFSLVMFFIAITWGNDLSGSRFLISSFLSSIRKLTTAARSNRQISAVMMMSACCEASIIIFTFYWAPWLTSVIIEVQPITTFPYQVIFSIYIAGSMIGAYGYQLFVPSVGIDNLFQAVLVLLSASYFLGAVFQTPLLVFGLSFLLHLLSGAYWPCIGYCRGRVVLPEMRSTSLCISK